MNKIILASASPRRKELLEQMGVEFSIVVSNFEEQITDSNPERIAEELAAGKALDVAKQIGGNHFIIGADTIVVAEGRILGKPEDEEDAFRMIKMLQGNQHVVYTGVALIATADVIVKKEIFSVCTKVEVCSMSDQEIIDYISTGEPMDKAGAYGIQGLFGKHIKGIVGDYNNVVGLPIHALYEKFKIF